MAFAVGQLKNMFWIFTGFGMTYLFYRLCIRWECF